MGAAPCGDPGLPNVPSSNPMSKAAELVVGIALGSDASCRLPAVDPADLAPEPLASRLDDPPDSPSLA
ncbi:hypothetical protein [Singulisphaera sp. PoT]|uniref:hypothetical protein n=1 Tax=Singulisphaera sp. PoT TaxID=3411797 RepID=UPI003BF4ABAC